MTHSIEKELNMPIETGFNKEPRSLHIQVKDSKQRYDLSLEIDYPDTTTLEEILNKILPIAAEKGTLISVLNHFKGLSINGVKIEFKNPVVERNEHYYKTGN